MLSTDSNHFTYRFCIPTFMLNKLSLPKEKQQAVNYVSKLVSKLKETSLDKILAHSRFSNRYRDAILSTQIEECRLISLKSTSFEASFSHIKIDQSSILYPCFT